MKHLFVFGSFQALFDGQSGIRYYGLVVTCGQITQKAFIVSPVKSGSGSLYIFAANAGVFGILAFASS